MDLFSQMQILPYFAMIYFHGHQNVNNFAWTYFRGCKMTNVCLYCDNGGKTTFATLPKMY